MMKRRNFLMAFVGFVGTLGTTKLVAEPKNKVKQNNTETESPPKAKNCSVGFVCGNRWGLQPSEFSHACIENSNEELKVYDIVYHGGNGRITKEPHGDPIGIVMQTTINCTPNQSKVVIEFFQSHAT